MNNNKKRFNSLALAGILLTAVSLSLPARVAAQAAASGTSPAPAAPFVLTLSTGFQKVVNLPALPARVSVGDPSIASVTVLKPTDRGGKSAGVLVTGLKAGSTSLLIWDRGASMARVITVAVTGKAAETIANLKDLNLETEGQVLKLSGSTP
ncbi:MAG TPA: pilus assembly protein N-terminal domain-containing protein, partial [Limnobacter sp.]|nr:pilus assembly protein N-terminal domain-containing protein [Limnobacter sp.]